MSFTFKKELNFQSVIRIQVENGKRKEPQNNIDEPYRLPPPCEYGLFIVGF
jgi:hypothetical protein